MQRLLFATGIGNVSTGKLPLPDVLEAAAEAGFYGMSVSGRARRPAVGEGVTDGDLRKMANGAGLAMTELEAAGDWLSPPIDGSALSCPVYSWEEYLAIREAIGARTLVAVHFGDPAPVDAAADAFARLCDRAAECGLDVALEYPAWATIGDLGTALAIVDEANRANGGLLVDSWHHRRGGGDNTSLTSIPGDRILSVQVADGAAEPVGPLVEDVARRRMPGDGDLDMAGFLQTLRANGVKVPITVEVYDSMFVAEGATAMAGRLHQALRGAVDASLVRLG